MVKKSDGSDTTGIDDNKGVSGNVNGSGRFNVNTDRKTKSRGASKANLTVVPESKEPQAEPQIEPTEPATETTGDVKDDQPVVESQTVLEVNKEPDGSNDTKEQDSAVNEDPLTQLTLGDNGDVNDSDTDDTDDDTVAEQVKKPKFERSSMMKYFFDNATVQSLYREWQKDKILRNKRESAIMKAVRNGTPVPEGDDGTVLRFDLTIQRNEVWGELQSSDFIHTAIYGFYIAPVLVQDSNDGKKWFLDGKQRITKLMKFIDGEWSLNKKTEDVQGIKIAGCKFNDLPEGMKNAILETNIQLVIMKNMTDAERDKLFVKVNSGSPLSRIELTRAKHSTLISAINEISNLKFFKNIELSKQARDRFLDQEIILQITMLLDEGKDSIKGFGANHIEEYVLRLKATDKTVSQEMVNRFVATTEYLEAAIVDLSEAEVKRALKKIHVPIIFWVAELAIDAELEPQLFGKFIRSFLINNYSINSNYGKSCQSGSSKKDSVLTRIAEMKRSLELFVVMVNNASTIEEGLGLFDKNLAEANGIVTDETDYDDGSQTQEGENKEKQEDQGTQE